jgi:hypothetical protein
MSRQQIRTVKREYLGKQRDQPKATKHQPSELNRQYYGRPQTHLVIESTTNCSIGAAVFVQELDEVSLATALLIIDNLLICALGEELDCRETPDLVFELDLSVLRSIRVKIRNDTLGEKRPSQAQIALNI